MSAITKIEDAKEQLQWVKDHYDELPSSLDAAIIDLAKAAEDVKSQVTAIQEQAWEWGQRAFNGNRVQARR